MSLSRSILCKTWNIWVMLRGLEKQLKGMCVSVSVHSPFWHMERVPGGIMGNSINGKSRRYF